MMNKKIMIIGCFTTIMLFMISCNLNSRVRINNELIDNTMRIEELDHKLSNFRITYDEYVKNMTSLAGKTDIEKSYQRKYIADPIDLKVNKEDELELWNERYGSNTVELKVSNVFDYLDIKYVFTKVPVVPKDELIDEGGV